MIGKVISHYNVLEKLGGGGMGVVYKAEDTKLHRTVALKFLPSSFSFEEEAKQRFALEAQAASALQHNNICTIHEIAETEDGQSFIVMDYYDGKTLKDKIKKKPMDFDEFFKISIQIAEGISKAHQNRIIHRDIKPANIFITKDGVAKILDFGLAKLSGQTMMTQTGSTLGTVAYISPEQARGEEVDHRADIWSFGIVMYEMLTGQIPFKSEYEQATIYSILNDEIKPISSIRPEINPELDTLVMDCLVKDQNERCQSTAELRRRLRFIAGTPKLAQTKTVVQKTISSPKEIENKIKESSSKKCKWFAVSLIGLIIIMAALWITQEIFKPEEIDLSNYTFTPIATDSEDEGGAEWSPDGKSIVYYKRVNGYLQVFIRNLSSPISSQVTFLDKKSAHSPFWSPDGNFIYFTSQSHLFSIAVAGGEPKKILDIGSTATISPDAKYIVFWSSNEIIDSDSTKSRRIKTSVYILSLIDQSIKKYEPAPFEINCSYAPNYIQFSPDGKKIGLFIYAQEAKGTEFWILPWPNEKNAKPYKIFESAQFILPGKFSWMPDSRNVIISGNLKQKQGASLFLGDTETDELKNITYAHKGEYHYGSVSPDGNKIALTEGYSHLNILNIPLDGSKPEVLMETSRDDHSLSFSRSGNKSTYITNRNGDDEIWLRKNDEDIRPIVTKSDLPDFKYFNINNANISPDGNRVAFRLYRDKIGSKLFVTTSEGGKTTRILSGDNFEQICSWSPDSKSLVVRIYYDTANTLAIVKLGSQEKPKTLNLTINDCGSWAYWSPDGKWISYFNGKNITLISSDGKVRKEIPSPVSSFNGIMVWSNEGSYLYLASWSGGLIRLYKLDINTGKSQLIKEHKSDLYLGTHAKYSLFGCLTPDGKNIVTTVVEDKTDIWIMEGFPKP